jgi:hypothetical protein
MTREEAKRREPLFTNSFILFVAKVGQGRRVIQYNCIQDNDTQRN